MATVYDRQRDGEQLREDNTGFEAAIRYRVRETAFDLDNICTAHTRGFSLGDPHPCVPGLVCVDILTVPEQADNATFVLDYIFRAEEPEATPGGEFAMSGSLSEQRTTRDRDDAQTVLTYTYPATYKDPILAGNTRTQPAEFEVARPTLLLRWSRLQALFATAWANRAVLGTVNEFTEWGFGPELLLCTRMEIERANQSYREIFEFQYTGVRWQAYAIFNQEDDNRPVENPDSLAEQFIDVYPTFNFATLGLLLPT